MIVLRSVTRFTIYAHIKKPKETAKRYIMYTYIYTRVYIRRRRGVILLNGRVYDFSAQKNITYFYIYGEGLL